MSNLREIKKRISSVTSTKQITRTMEMVSTAKIRRALDRAAEAEPYKKALTDVMLTVAEDNEAQGDNPMLKRHDPAKHGVIIAIASDRGLAGGFNVNVERTVERATSDWAKRGLTAEVIACGRKPVEYFSKHGNLVMHFEGHSAEPKLEDARMIANYICDGWKDGKIDRVKVVYHHARNRVDQELREEQLLPLHSTSIHLPRGPRKNEEDGPERVSSSFEFVPNSEHVLGELVPSYVLTVIHQALIDSAASEQGARRKAMHSATENATSIIATLTRTYNRVRQASITTELNEIVAGAAALEEN